MRTRGPQRTMNYVQGSSRRNGTWNLIASNFAQYTIIFWREWVLGIPDMAHEIWFLVVLTVNNIFVEKDSLGLLTCSQGTMMRSRKPLRTVTSLRLSMRMGSCAMRGAARGLTASLVTYMSWSCTSMIIFCCIFRLYNLGLQCLHELKSNKAKAHQHFDHWQEEVEWGGWQEVTA